MYHTAWCQILWVQHWHSDNTLEPWNETSPVQQYPKPCNKNIMKLYLFIHTRHSITYEYGSNCTCNLTRVSSTVNLQVKNDAPIVGLMWWLNILPIYLKTMLVLPTPTTHHKVRLGFPNQHFNQTVLALLLVYWNNVFQNNYMLHGHSVKNLVIPYLYHNVDFSYPKMYPKFLRWAACFPLQ